MRSAFDTLLGLFDLTILFIRARILSPGRYWRWRLETAFGNDPTRWPPRRQRLQVIFHYARWVRRMKRLP